MKSCRILCVLTVLSSCSSSEIRPVDAKFRATVVGDGVPKGSVVSVDVYWREDGTVDVRFDDVDGVIPGPDELKYVVLKEGNSVLFEGQTAIAKGGEKHLVRLEGDINPESLDLELSDTPPGGVTARVRLRGAERPLGDPAALDGEYIVFTERYPAHCPGDNRPPLSRRNMTLDVLPDDVGARLTLDGRLVFSVLDVEGLIDRKVYVYDRRTRVSREISVYGTIAADEIILTLDSPDAASGPGCVDRLVVTGSKRLPDPAVIEGDYRADYVWTDACHSEGGMLSAPVKLVGQAEDRYDFFELDVWLQFEMRAGDPFKGDFYAGAAVLHYAGVIDPPRLSYRAIYTFAYEKPCDVTIDVTAYKRYFFPQDAE